MDLPHETLTPILGESATYDPKTETTPNFMNGKFSELLENDQALNQQLNVLSTTVSKAFSDSEMYNGWHNGIEGDPEWSRCSVHHIGKILFIYIYNVIGGTSGTKIFDLPIDFPASWYGDGVVGMNGREVILYGTNVYNHMFMCFGM